MQVLNIYRTYFPDPPGGLQEAIRQICHATASYDVNNIIYTLSPTSQPRNIKFPEAEVVRECSWMAPASCDIGGLAAFKTYNTLARQSDVVHYYHPWPFADLLNVTTRVNKPKVLTYISDVVRQRVLNTFYSPLMWKHLHDMDVIVANCPAYAQTSPILTHKSIRDKVRVIPLGIDDRLYPQLGDDSIFKRSGFADDEPYFLFLGVHRYYKGIHTLISAAQYTKAKIVIAGSGPKTVELKSQAAQLGLKNVLFVGQVTDQEKVSLFKKCRAFVLPSHLRSEAYGMVLVEASMLSKPMISCEIGTGTSFINQDGETGLVVSPELPKQLADAINSLYENELLAQEMGRQARLRYERLFSANALGQAYSDLYREVI